jgi:acyl-CoA synthetase (NDP forming)
VTNAGGPGILFADACEAGGLVLPELDPATRDSLRAFLPANASVSNPIDMIASAPAEHYERAMGIAGASKDVDALAVIYIPPYATSVEEIAASIARGAGRVPKDKPVLVVYVSSRTAPEAIDRGPRGKLPCYHFPENAARSLAAAARYVKWRARPDGHPYFFDDATTKAVRDALDRAVLRADGSGWLAFEDAAAIIQAAGIPLAPAISTTVEGVENAASRIGFPLVLKGIAQGIVHKSDAGLVHVGLDTIERVRTAMRDVEGRAKALVAKLEGVLLEKEVKGGVEMIAGVATHPTFGPLVVAGMGGVEAELVHDVALRLTPMTELDAEEMIDSLRLKKRLEPFRGAPKRDRKAYAKILLALSALVEVAPEIAELDLNPVMVLPEGEGAVAVDVRIKIGSAR